MGTLEVSQVRYNNSRVDRVAWPVLCVCMCGVVYVCLLLGTLEVSQVRTPTRDLIVCLVGVYIHTYSRLSARGGTELVRARLTRTIYPPKTNPLLQEQTMKIQSRRERIRQLVGHLKKSLATLGRLKVGGSDTYYGYKCVRVWRVRWGRVAR